MGAVNDRNYYEQGKSPMRKSGKFLTRILGAAGLLAALAVSAGAQTDTAVPDLDPAGCADGSFVTDPDANPELVADCRVLTAIRNHWTGHPANAGLPADDSLLTWGSGDTVDITSWTGVEIHRGRIGALDLRDEQIAGPIPSQLGSLDGLTVLYLGFNELTGTIPPELGNLDHLTRLYLDGNNLTGTIPPELGNLSRLSRLYLDRNGLTGTIPPELGDLDHLTRLYLDNNRLSGPIPPELGDLDNLILMWLHSNRLTGPIPPELGNLDNVTHLWLDDNGLTGSIPPELGDLDSLAYLDLKNNGLTGPIPPQLGDLDNLARLYLDQNQLSGGVPTALSRLSRLTHLYLDRNRLTGSIPPELGDLENLEQLSLYGNRLTGTIPPELGNLSRLNHLDLDQNRLTGTIPPELGDLGNLTELWLDRNQLTGTIPPELGKLSRLVRLFLGCNQLTGRVPPELGRIPFLSWLNLYPNPLTGTAPPELGELVFLRFWNFAGRFCDDEGSVHEPNIETAAGWGITLGCEPNRFCPNSPITRSQMAAFLHRAVTHHYGAPDPAAGTALSDVPDGAWYREFAQWAASSGVMPAQDGAFRPDQAVSRAEMAVMLTAAFRHLNPTEQAGGLFADMDDQSPEAVRAAEGLRIAGVTSGCLYSPLRYCPDRPVTRAQMSSFLVRAIAP